VRKIGLHLFCSVKGGVGKSTLSVVAAKLLAKRGKVPVLVDTDMLGSSLADGLALCAPVVAESEDGLLDLEAQPTGQWYSLLETRELRQRRRDWLERNEDKETSFESAVAPAYLNDALHYLVPDPRHDCSVVALLWKHETKDDVWYLPSSPLQVDAARAAPHSVGAGDGYDWIRRLSWVLDGVLEQKPEVTDIVLDLPPGTWGFAHQILLLAGHLSRSSPLPAGYPNWSQRVCWLVNPFIVTSRDRNDRVVAIEYFIEVKSALPLLPLCNRLSGAPASLRAEIRRDLPKALQSLGIEDLLRVVPELPHSLGRVFTEGNVVVEEEEEIAKALRLDSYRSKEGSS
jgi:hypothetical protein